LGERELTPEDFLALSERLAAYRFDLAVDLRKHVATREILRLSGARYLAGFDHHGQFPFLDIAVEWGGDKGLQLKRNHVTDDLTALVDALASACAERHMVQPLLAPGSLLESLPEEARALFAKPVVVIHPGAGNTMKQWPAEHFSALVDLLTESGDANVLLVGGPDEQELADTLLDTVHHRNAVTSVAGRTSLDELVSLLRASVLYVGNDSGPKHIAAALGIPTIGIHSGVVDATEWGPVGPRALALRRVMSCGPCYIASADRCPRKMACLQFLEPSFVYEAARMLLARPIADDAKTATGCALALNPEPRIVARVEAGSANPDHHAQPMAARARSAKRQAKSGQGTNGVVTA
jgi:ADP-heptose:LPS heptosyltransferase